MPEISSSPWQIVKPFMKFGAVVGLHMVIDGQQSALHFSSILARMESRWADIERELDDLWDWWVSASTDHNETNTKLYAESNARCLAERRQLEELWLDVRKYIPVQEPA